MEDLQLPEFFKQSPIALDPIDKVLWLKGWMISTHSRLLEPFEVPIHRAMFMIEQGAGQEVDANRRQRDAVQIIDKAVRAAYAFRCEKKDKGRQMLVQLGAVIQCISNRCIADAFNDKSDSDGLVFHNPTTKSMN